MDINPKASESNDVYCAQISHTRTYIITQKNMIDYRDTWQENRQKKTKGISTILPVFLSKDSYRNFMTTATLFVIRDVSFYGSNCIIAFIPSTLYYISQISSIIETNSIDNLKNAKLLKAVACWHDSFILPLYTCQFRPTLGIKANYKHLR